MAGDGTGNRVGESSRDVDMVLRSETPTVLLYPADTKSQSDSSYRGVHCIGIHPVVLKSPRPPLFLHRRPDRLHCSTDLLDGSKGARQTRRAAVHVLEDASSERPSSSYPSSDFILDFDERSSLSLPSVSSLPHYLHPFDLTARRST